MTFDKKLLLNMYRPKVTEIVLDHGGQQATLHAKQLSAAEVFELQELQKAGEKAQAPDVISNFTFALIAKSLCDADGNLLLSSTEEAKGLAGMQVDAFNKLVLALGTAAGLGMKGVVKDGEDKEPPNVSKVSQ